MAKANFTPRVRFNWGFWDGLNDGKARRHATWSSHFDNAYERGYWAGRAAAQGSEAPTSSDAAWKESGK